MFARSLVFAAFLSLPGLAHAGGVALPMSLSWCDDEADVLLGLDDARVITEGVIESQAMAFGLRGTLTALTEDGVLVGVRFRMFDTDANLAKVKSTLTKRHGEGTWKDRSSGGADRRLKGEWEIDAQQSLAVKVNSEQIYVTWELDSSKCLAQEGPHDGSLTDAEKADIEATTKKKAIAFDPFAEDIEDVDARKKASDDAKKSEEEKQREEEEEEAKTKAPEDVDIDW